MIENNGTPIDIDSLKLQSVTQTILDGPIPADSLAFLDLVEPYLEMEFIDWVYDIQLMLRTLCKIGVPKWWKRDAAEFEIEFHKVFDKRVVDLDEATPKNREKFINAADHMVESGYLAPLQSDPTREQYTAYVEQGKKSLLQQYALEIILEMWCIEWDSENC
jgi:hypothetical protein